MAANDCSPVSVHFSGLMECFRSLYGLALKALRPGVSAMNMASYSPAAQPAGFRPCSKTCSTNRVHAGVSSSQLFILLLIEILALCVGKVLKK